MAPGCQPRRSSVCRPDGRPRVGTAQSGSLLSALSLDLFHRTSLVIDGRAWPDAFLIPGVDGLHRFGVRRSGPAGLRAACGVSFIGYSRGRRPIALGSRPPGSQPPITAASGMPTRMSSRLATGMLVSEDSVSSWLVWKKPIAAMYPATTPTTAPLSASAPAVAADIARRAVLPAPVAASMRRSLAVSLRSRPTLMARMPSASGMPKAVATLRISADVGMLLRVSTDRPAAAAACSAALIWPAVGGCGAGMSQPAVLTDRWNWRTARSVITVFGADVPDGSALTSWIFGFARHEPGRQGEPGPVGPIL